MVPIYATTPSRTSPPSRALASELGTYKRPHNSLPNHIASTLSAFMDGALHGLYIHTHKYPYQKKKKKKEEIVITHIHATTQTQRKETHNTLSNGDTNLAHHK
jgi:hypothetical protein